MSHAAVSLSGTIGKDAELKQTANGGWMARFNVATNSQVRNQSGGYDDVVSWFRVTYFARSDKWMAQFVKGAKVFITGELIHRSYPTRDGNTAYSLEVTASHAESLSPRQDAPQERPQQRRATPDRPPVQDSADFDDGIPF